ncbi:MAG: BamA/TamA family outer membrane protein [Dictyoglomus sp.]|nr:BamA/TamA family outer membrane protein [Dictyoglomus sp.]MCX7942818.1 BamA/TamA family outer membrane protein [Dictyoglomaceae bacterium]MDW8188374.1 POTRA domain-containing protein [Dictyoglomus sp.]
MKKFIYILVLFLVIFNHVFSQQVPYKILNIDIQGNQKISKEEILKIINIKIGSEIDDKKLEEVKKRLEETTFFLSVNILKEVKKDGIILTFQLIETPFLVWISGIRFLGLKNVEINTIKNLLFLPHLGWSTDLKIWDQRKRFLETGYFEDIEIKEEKTESGIILNFIFTERPILERIGYFGVNKASLEKIQEIVQLKPGDFISKSLLEEKKESLIQTGFFSKVDFIFTEENKRAYVFFYFVENPLISEISFEGLNNITNLEIIEILDLKGKIENNVFKPSEKLFYSEKLMENYIEKLLTTGYFEKISWEIEEKENIKVRLVFKENLPILRISIQGNVNLPTDKIISLLSLRKKEFYNEDFVEEKRNILLNSSYFDSVEVKKIFSSSGVYLTFIVKENPIISSIRLEGLKYLDFDVLERYIILKKGDFLNENKIKEQISKFEESGYFQDIDVVKNINQDKVDLVFKLKENPIINKITFKGLYSLAFDELKKIMSLKEGRPINYNLLREDINNLQKYLQQKGFVFTILQEFRFTEEGYLIFFFREYIVEEINVQIQPATETSTLSFMAFLRRPTEENVVRREISLKVLEAFNWEKVKQDLQRIYNTGIFEDVSIKLEPGSEEDKIKVIYIAKEKLTGSINFGGGYGISTGFYGYIEYMENNLFGKAQKLSLNLQIVGSGKMNYQISFSDPWFLGDRNNFQLKLYDKKSTITTIIENESKNIDEERVGGSFSFYYPIVGNLSLGLGFKYEKVWQRISGATYTENDIASINLSVMRDTRDFILNPTQGSRQVLSAEFAGGGSSSNYAKYQGELQWHFPLTNRDAITLSQMKERQVLSLKFGIGLSEGNLPSSELFTLGGANSIRGYVDNEFRGDAYIVLNLQYRFPLGSGLYGVLFFDLGNAFSLRSISSLRDIKLYSGIGIGIRYETLVIPIRLDFGYNFGQDPLDPNTRWRIHFSFGDVF